MKLELKTLYHIKNILISRIYTYTIYSELSQKFEESNIDNKISFYLLSSLQSSQKDHINKPVEEALAWLTSLIDSLEDK